MQSKGKKGDGCQKLRNSLSCSLREGRKGRKSVAKIDGEVYPGVSGKGCCDQGRIGSLRDEVVRSHLTVHKVYSKRDAFGKHCSRKNRGSSWIRVYMCVYRYTGIYVMLYITSP